jgi:hypothetical protein
MVQIYIAAPIVIVEAQMLAVVCRRSPQPSQHLGCTGAHQCREVRAYTFGVSSLQSFTPDERRRWPMECIVVSAYRQSYVYSSKK